VTRIAVLGAGNGGQATAAHLALEGHTVRLFDRFPSVIEPFARTRTLSITGAITGTVTIDEATTDIASAVRGAEVILVTAPGFALDWIAANLAPSLVAGQVVILHPGGTGGALSARRVWSEVGVQPGVVLAETDTLIYACRLQQPGQPDVKAIKREVALAALPAEDLDVAYSAFSELYPQARRSGNVLETSLANMNAVIHPTVALLNAGTIDRGGHGFDFYGTGVTPGIGRAMLQVDAERLAVAAALGVHCVPYDEWVRAHYGVEADSPTALFERLAATVYQGIGTPESLEARYISEDVPMALVTIEALASLLDLETPTITAIITLCSAVNAADYRHDGRTLERLGLAGLTPDRIRRYVGEAKP
jgi:opine dehydrogenase